jgi:hypothetical protein
VTKVTADKALAEHAEKRVYERYNCEAPIKWSYFNQNRCFDARILNFSRNGLYFETPYEIGPKATIFIRLETPFTNNESLTEHECFRTVSISEVRWCHEVSKDDISYYAVGVRHSDVK